MAVTPALRSAFLLSGVAGLVYEVLWSRYLGLFVGHSAYAQILVLAVYLGGMAVGARAISGLSKRLQEPLKAYALAEVALAGFGLLFHAVFVWVTDFSYDVLFPALGSAAWSGSARWAIAGVLILPQAVVLGTTFPLMAAGLVRRDRAHPGSRVADAYLLNTLGGAFGVLLAGFGLIGWFGLAGTSVAAAVMNLVAAGLVWSNTRPSSATVAPSEPVPVEPEVPADDREAWAPATARIVPVLLVVAFATAVASFAYEIAWIRMLSLVLGSATHAFELMLSAFILGIALGAWAIREASDRTPDPIHLLGRVQVWMGLAAIVSLPLYLASFSVMADFMTTVPRTDGGYLAFNAGRYALCLAIMLPATVLAGATLPLVTGALLRQGLGERTIGRVYSVNTVGSVVGAGIAGLIALPYLGLEGLVIAGATLDLALGIWLLERSTRWSGTRRPWMATAGAGAVAIFVVAALTDFAPTVVTSGVYRNGELAVGDEWRSLYYQDGRTATVSAHVGTADGVTVLATNGKPDASMGPRWKAEGRDTLTPRPVPRGRDMTTQVLAPIVGMAYHPEARTAVNIGHGSGMSGAAILTSPALERMVTIEIEPLMVEGSLVFLPANESVFSDPRSSFVFDDAKTFLSYQEEAFDIIFTEPSNPWVSGTASLFTKEFYANASRYLAAGGVFTQWVQIYEMDDGLFLSVLAALDETFSSYRGYLVGDADVAIVASRGELPEPDWSVLDSDPFLTLTNVAPRVRAQHMNALLLFDEETLRPLLDGRTVANSDYNPILDLGSERTRFTRQSAYGIYSLGTERVDLGQYLSGWSQPRTAYAMAPAYGLGASVLAERAAWLRETIQAGGGIAPEEFAEWQNDLVHLQTFFTLGESATTESEWETWAAGFVTAENVLHHRSWGWIDTTFYARVDGALTRESAPAAAHATVQLLRSYALGEWLSVAEAADILRDRVLSEERWVPSGQFVEIATIGYVESGRMGAATTLLDQFEGRTRRGTGHLRDLLLRAIVDRAAGPGGND